LQEVAAIERQFHDAPVFDDGSNRGVFGVEQQRSAGDFEGLGDRSHLELKVNAGHLRNLQLDLVADLVLEALYFHPEAVESRKQSGEHVVARAIGLHLPREICLWIGDCDARSCHHGAGGVGNYPGDLALRLRPDERSRA